MQLEDTRELVGKTATDHRAELGLYAAAASSAVFELLNAYPDVELATLQFRVDADTPPDITITVTGRRGPLIDGEAGCPSCHVHGDQPHTEYCQLVEGRDTVDLVGALRAAVDAARERRMTEDAAAYVAEPEWIDDGCRCPSRENHLEGCPVLDSPLTGFPE
jgi:hypothetical protein